MVSSAVVGHEDRVCVRVPICTVLGLAGGLHHPPARLSWQVTRVSLTRETGAAEKKLASVLQAASSELLIFRWRSPTPYSPNE